jgi:hypothetical protein
LILVFSTLWTLLSCPTQGYWAPLLVTQVAWQRKGKASYFLFLWFSSPSKNVQNCIWCNYKFIKTKTIIPTKINLIYTFWSVSWCFTVLSSSHSRFILTNFVAFTATNPQLKFQKYWIFDYFRANLGIVFFFKRRFPSKNCSKNTKNGFSEFL